MTDEPPEGAPPRAEGGTDWESRDYGRIGPGVWALGGLMVALGIATSALMLGDFEAEGYLYLAFYSIPSNTAISVFPHEPVLIYYGKIGDVWITAAAATAGTLVAGWMDHAVFTPVLNLKGRQSWKEGKLYQRSVEYFRRWPFATLVVAGLTPVPLWPFKLLAFSAHYPLRRYLAALAVGRFPRYAVLAWVGVAFGDVIPDWALIALFAAVLLTYAWRAAPEVWERWKERGEEEEA